MLKDGKVDDKYQSNILKGARNGIDNGYYEHQNVKQELAEIFFNLGYIHFKKKYHKKCLGKCKQVLRFYKEVYGNEDFNVAKTMRSTALAHSKQNHYSKAMEFFEEALHIRIVYNAHGDIWIEVTDTHLGITFSHEN